MITTGLDVIRQVCGSAHLAQILREIAEEEQGLVGKNVVAFRAPVKDSGVVSIPHEGGVA